MIKKYNQKLDFLVSKYTNHQVEKWNTHQTHLKNVFDEKVVPKDDYEKQILIVKECLKIIKKQKDFNLQTIQNFCDLLSIDIKVNNLKLDIFIKESKSEEELLYRLLSTNIFGEYTFELSVLTYNYMRMLNNKIPIGIAIPIRDELLLVVKDNCDYKSFLNILDKAIYKCLRLNVVHNNINNKKIIDLLISKKEYLLKKYNIEKVYIYGSLLRGNMTKYSDLDIFCIVKEAERKNIKLKFELKAYLEKLIGLPVDIHVNDIEFSYDLFTEETKQTLTQII